MLGTRLSGHFSRSLNRWIIYFLRFMFGLPSTKFDPFSIVRARLCVCRVNLSLQLGMKSIVNHAQTYYLIIIICPFGCLFTFNGLLLLSFYANSNCFNCLHAHDSKQITSTQLNNWRERKRDARHHSLNSLSLIVIAFALYGGSLLSLLHLFNVVDAISACFTFHVVKRARRNEYRRKYKIQLHLFSFRYFTLVLLFKVFVLFYFLFHIFFLFFSILLCDSLWLLFIILIEKWNGIYQRIT